MMMMMMMMMSRRRKRERMKIHHHYRHHHHHHHHYCQLLSRTWQRIVYFHLGDHSPLHLNTLEVTFFSVRMDFHCRVIFAWVRKSWTSLHFYVFAWPTIHCLYFIYARTHVKITRKRKSTFRYWLRLLDDNSGSVTVKITNIGGQ